MQSTLDLSNVLPENRELFSRVWSKLESEIPADQFVFPREITWLNGAPGAGKGTHTKTILALCGYTAGAVCISDLLQTPEAKKIKDAGLLVGDENVLELMLRKLMEPALRNGVIIDGFPRTQIQVDCLLLLKQKLQNTNFQVLVLHVDEQTSIERQLHRGRTAQANPASGEELRKTDLDPKAAAFRYETFIEMTYEPLQTLKGVFPYHQIDAQGNLEEVRANIEAALRA